MEEETKKNYSDYYSSDITQPTYDNSKDQEYLDYLNKSKENSLARIDELTNNLKDKSYQELLKSNVALQNAKDTALKYTNNAMKASGYGSQGYGETNFARNNNAYLNSLGTIKSNYNDNLSDIEQSAIESKLSAEQNYDEAYLSMLQNQSNRAWEDYQADKSNYFNQQNQIANWKKNDADNNNLADTTNNDDIFTDIYNYVAGSDYDTAIEYLKKTGYVDDDGNIIANGLNETQQTRLKNLLYTLETGTTDNSTNNGFYIKNQSYSDLDTKMSFYYQTTDGKMKQANNKFREELETLKERLFNGKDIVAGDIVHLINGYDDSIYLKINEDGTFTQVSESAYDKVSSSKQKEIENTENGMGTVGDFSLFNPRLSYAYIPISKMYSEGTVKKGDYFEYEFEGQKFYCYINKNGSLGLTTKEEYDKASSKKTINLEDYYKKQD